MIILLVQLQFVLVVVEGLIHNSFAFSQQPPRNVRRNDPRPPHGWMKRSITSTTATTLCFATTPTQQQHAEVVVLVHTDDDDDAPLSSASHPVVVVTT